MPKAPESELALGWKVNKQFEPEYWLSPKATPGQHQPGHLVRVPASSMNNHMVVVAQSGSGKSFFLGRILEELLLQTGSRVVIFDPNSDFRGIGDLFEPEFWNEKATAERKVGYGYDRDKRRGFLPTETSRDAFESKWKLISKFVSSSLPEKNDYHQRLQIDWPSMSIDILTDELDATLQTEVKHCHNFAQMISQLVIVTKQVSDKNSQNFLDIAKELCQATKGRTEQEVLFHIRHRFPVPDVRSPAPAIDRISSRLLSLFRSDLTAAFSKRSIEELHQRATIHRSFVSDTAERFYFSAAYAVRQSGLLRDGNATAANLDDLRLHVVDLPSINDRRFRHLIVSTLLDLEWERARRKWREALKKNAEEDDRAPTFIVVDEAHNLVPFDSDNPTELWLREKFRTVAAEGRKFGLYLILVSQRPDKLDTIVLSECENKVVMRLGSPAVLAKTAEILSLADIPKMTQPCLNFDTGRALIVGAWSPEPTFLYGAARRTKEGGRNLQAEHWAHPAPLDAKSEPPVIAEGTDKGGEVGKKETGDKISPDERPAETASAKPENGDIAPKPKR